MNVHGAHRVVAGLLILASSACKTNQAAGTPDRAAWVDENLIDLRSQLRNFDFGRIPPSPPSLFSKRLKYIIKIKQ